MISGLFFLILSSGLLLVTSQHTAQAIKEYVSGYMTYDSMINAGESWFSDGILHRRDALYK